jgi:hypothetical protein
MSGPVYETPRRREIVRWKIEGEFVAEGSVFFG